MISSGISIVILRLLCGCYMKQIGRSHSIIPCWAFLGSDLEIYFEAISYNTQGNIFVEASSFWTNSRL